jgi:predicted nucleic acid-binding protein
LTIVVDASVAAAWLVDDTLSIDAVSLLDEKEELIAPDFLTVEVANVLWKRLMRGELEEEIAEKLLAHFAAVGIKFERSSALVSAGLALARTLRHPVYDCLYLALAQDRGVPLATFDSRMAAAARTAAIPLWTPRRR